jgi:hypothetical protein
VRFPALSAMDSGCVSYPKSLVNRWDVRQQARSAVSAVRNDFLPREG